MLPIFEEWCEKKLELTPYQKDRINDFKDALMRLRNAGVLPIEVLRGEIIFVNGLEVETQWAGIYDDDECPFEPDCVVHSSDVDKENISYDAMFANYVLPSETLHFKFKQQSNTINEK